MAYPRIELKGRLTRDPEIRWTNNGTAMLKAPLVATQRAKDPQTGEWKDKGDPCFLDAIVWGKQAETLAEQAHKGTEILCVGKLEPNNWIGENGQENRRFQIQAETLAIIPKWQGNTQPANTGGWNDPVAAEIWQQPAPQPANVNDDTPPF